MRPSVASKNKNPQEAVQNSVSIKSAFSSVSKNDSVNRRSPGGKEHQHSKIILSKRITKINSVECDHFSGGEAADGSQTSLSYVYYL